MDGKLAMPRFGGNGHCTINGQALTALAPSLSQLGGAPSLEVACPFLVFALAWAPTGNQSRLAASTVITALRYHRCVFFAMTTPSACAPSPDKPLSCRVAAMRIQ